MTVSLRDDLLAQGYFEQPAIVPPDLISRARHDVESHPEAVDAFLDDAMWDILDAILPSARVALAREVAILPGVWAWRVAPGDRGWGPHRDNPAHARDDHGELTRITIWVPLTDATTRNGCIHCVPAYWDYSYQNPKGGNVISAEQCIRAVPATTGSILGWSHALLHWGGACAPDAPPRLATSFELIRSDLAHTEPTHPAGWRPAPSERAAYVAAMREKYGHMLDPHPR